MFCLNLCLFCSILQGLVCTKFTIIYEEYFQDQIHSIETTKDNSIRLLSAEKNLSLQSLLTINQTDVYFSFAPTFLLPFDNDESALLNGMKLDFKDSLQALQNSLVNSQISESFDYSPYLRKTLTALIYSIFNKDVAIVTEHIPFVEDFYTSLENEVRVHKMYSQLRPRLHHVVYDSKQIRDQSHVFYQLKGLGISLVIMLVQQENTNNLLKNAEHFALLGSSQLWLIPNYDENRRRSHEPARTLTFRTDKREWNEKYQQLGQSINTLIDVYGDFEKQCTRRSPLKRKKISCMKEKMFSKMQDVQFDFGPGNLELLIRYRNLADKKTGWVNVSSEIIGSEFLIHDRNIALLRPVNDDFSFQNKITAVMVEDNPYSFRDDQSYDKLTGKCVTGIKCSYKSTDNNGNKTSHESCCIGYVIELFQLILSDLNLELDMYIVEDGRYGAETDGKWDGVVGDLASGKADIAIAGLSIASDRAKVVDFTSPWVEIDLGILVRPKINNLEFINFEFIAPLGKDLQIGLWIAIVSAIFVVFVIENNRYIASLSNVQFITDKYYPLTESISYISGVTLQRDLGGVNPKKPGARVASIFFAFGMVVVVTTYTALLVEQGVRREEVDPFTGSKDPKMRNPTSKFKFGTIKSTIYERFFAQSDNDVFRRISRFMEKYNYMKTEDAVRAVKNGDLDGFLYDYDFLVWYVSRDRDCELRVMKDTLIPSGLGFAMRKQFQWYSNFNQAVLRYRESDNFQGLFRKWFGNGGCDTDGLNSLKIQLGVNHFGGLFLLLIGCIVVSFPMLAPEHVYFRHLRGTFVRRIRNIFKFFSCQPKESKYTVN